jgi:hypothetical protein
MAGFGGGALDATNVRGLLAVIPEGSSVGEYFRWETLTITETQRLNVRDLPTVLDAFHRVAFGARDIAPWSYTRMLRSGVHAARQIGAYAAAYRFGQLAYAQATRSGNPADQVGSAVLCGQMAVDANAGDDAQLWYEEAGTLAQHPTVGAQRRQGVLDLLVAIAALRGEGDAVGEMTRDAVAQLRAPVLDGVRLQVDRWATIAWALSLGDGVRHQAFGELLDALVAALAGDRPFEPAAFRTCAALLGAGRVAEARELAGRAAAFCARRGVASLTGLEAIAGVPVRVSKSTLRATIGTERPARRATLTGPVEPPFAWLPEASLA